MNRINQVSDARPQTRLESFRERINAIDGQIADMHEVADRLLGTPPPATEKGASLSAAPNGMLDEMDEAIARLETRSSRLLDRLSSLA